MLLMATVFGLLLPRLLALVSWKKLLPNSVWFRLLLVFLFCLGSCKLFPSMNGIDGSIFLSICLVFLFYLVCWRSVYHWFSLIADQPFVD